MRVIITCAGTGGHITPAIAIADIIKKNYKDSEILFIGRNEGMENDLVKNAGYEIKPVRTGKLIRQMTLKNFSLILDAIRGIDDAKNIMREFKPDLVIGTGGYICVTVMQAALSLKVPYMLHESNAFPGLSVKLMAKKAYRVMLGFEDARSRLKNRENIVVTGNVCNVDLEKFKALDKNACRLELGIRDSNKKIVLVTFGSQGAKYLNDYIIDIARKQNDDIFFILIAGKNNYDEVMEKVNKISSKENIDMSKYIKVEKFVYEMDKMYKVADLCITRSGAMTITELETIKVPAILIPLPTAAENHQYYNAKVLENVGAASILEQKDLSVDALYSSILEKLTPIVQKRCVGSYNKLPINDVSSKILNEIRIFKEAYVKE